MKKLCILGAIILILLPVVSSAGTIKGLDVEWEGASSYTLSWTNPSISKGGYVIKVIDFDWKGNAVISVTRQGETQNGVLSEGESIIFDFTRNGTTFRGVRINANTISNTQSFPPNTGTYPCCPAAEISVEVSREIISQKKPKLELSLTTDWNGKLGSVSVMKIEIRNTGDADFSEGNITINLDGLKIAYPQELSDNALTYILSKDQVTRGFPVPLSAQNSYSLNISLKSPFPPNKSTFTIKAEVYFKDFEGEVYYATASEKVSVNPAIELKKTVTASTILGERMYGEVPAGYGGLGKITAINIYIKNIQSYPLRSVNLTDTIIQDFRLADNNTRLQWVFDLNASETKEFRYELTPQKMGYFTLPAAVAVWNEWGGAKKISSDQPTTRVYGVYVVVSKKTDKSTITLNESLNVSIRLENIGDFPVGINFTDILPKSTTFISGTATFSGYLRPRESYTMAYSLSADQPGEVEMPSPQVTFWKKDYEGSYGFIPASNITVLQRSAALLGDVTNVSQTAQIPEETPVPKSLLDIIGEKAPWLEGAFPILMLFIAVVLMMMLHIINRES